MKRILAASVLVLAALTGSAQAQAPGFSALYDIHFKGVVAGEYSFNATRTGDAYEATVNRKATGIARLAVKNSQDYSYKVSGKVTPQGLMPTAYEHRGGKRNRVVNATFTADDVVTTANPEMGMGTPPATKAQRAGVIDQVSLIYALATPSGDVCNRTLKVYMDGRSRFDLVLKPAGTQKVSTAAFKGTAQKCSVQYKPIAGFGDPQEPATLTFLFGKTGSLYAPVSIAMPTDEGIVKLEAKKFAPAA
jgi:hypothetical protein